LRPFECIGSRVKEFPGSIGVTGAFKQGMRMGQPPEQAVRMLFVNLLCDGEGFIPVLLLGMEIPA